eukprot:scaffold62823_cov67-Phaeocystis_antarctica.AAC.3
MRLSDGTHNVNGLVLDASLTLSRLEIISSNAFGRAFISSNTSTLLEVRAGAPPVMLQGLEFDGQVRIESSTEFVGCRFGSTSVRRGRRLQAGTEVRALLVSNGYVSISDTVFEDLLGGAIKVSGGSLAVHTSVFQNNSAESGGALLVTGGKVTVRNSTFTASQGTALHVIGGDVVLKDQTALLGGNQQTNLNISDGASVRYELPAPLGRYAFIQDNSGIYRFEPGEHLGDFPFACAAGVVGDSFARQSNPACNSVCPAGYSCGAGTVDPIACENGTFCPMGSLTTQDCPAGRVGMRPLLTSADDCEICPNGTRCPKGTAKVEPCGVGMYAPMPESEDCTHCETGKYQDEEGKDQCKICPAGSWCSAGSIISCPRDTFNNLTSQVSQGACTACPEDAVALEGSSSVSACKCVEDYYDAIDDPGDVECRRCPFGSACEGLGNTLARLPLLPGFWRTNNGSSDLRRCPDASTPDTSACANNIDGSLCKPWTAGPYCRICNVTDGSRYFDSDQSACVECGDTATTSLATLVGTTLPVLLLLCWCGWRKPCKRLRNAAYQALPKIRAPLKQMVAFYQVR